MVDNPATHQRMRLPTGADGWLEKRARSRSQIMGKARKHGAPARKCHQLPWLPGTCSLTASQAEVSKANGRNATAPAASQTRSRIALAHLGPAESVEDAEWVGDAAIWLAKNDLRYGEFPARARAFRIGTEGGRGWFR